MSKRLIRCSINDRIQCLRIRIPRLRILNKFFYGNYVKLLFSKILLSASGSRTANECGSTRTRIRFLNSASVSTTPTDLFLFLATKLRINVVDPYLVDLLLIGLLDPDSCYLSKTVQYFIILNYLQLFTVFDSIFLHYQGRILIGQICNNFASPNRISGLQIRESKTTKLILLDSLLQEAEHVARLYVSDSWGSQL
jgi:hypothetical protein